MSLSIFRIDKVVGTDGASQPEAEAERLPWFGRTEKLLEEEVVSMRFHVLLLRD